MRALAYRRTFSCTRVQTAERAQHVCNQHARRERQQADLPPVPLSAVAAPQVSSDASAAPSSREPFALIVSNRLDAEQLRLARRARERAIAELFGSAPSPPDRTQQKQAEARGQKPARSTESDDCRSRSRKRTRAGCSSDDPTGRVPRAVDEALTLLQPLLPLGTLLKLPGMGPARRTPARSNAATGSSAADSALREQIRRLQETAGALAKQQANRRRQ